MGLALEELLLVIPARAPREHTADIEIFAKNMAKHVGRLHAARGRGIVRASGGVNVMVAGKPAQPGWMNPTFQLKRLGMILCLRHDDLSPQHFIFRSPRVRDIIPSRRQLNRLAIGPIYLVLKEKIGRE